MFPARFHIAQKSPGQIANPTRLAMAYRFGGEQFTTDAERCGPGEDEFGCVLLTHASRGDQRNVREHPMEGSNVGFTANLGAGNNLDEIRSIPGNIRAVPPSAAQSLKQRGSVGITIGLRLNQVNDRLLIRLFRA
jgi:hypothetical protein